MSSEVVAETVGALIRRVFPRGTRPGANEEISAVPNWPPDLFAVTALLLEQSGAYHHIVSGPPPARLNDREAVAVSAEDLRDWQDLAAAWASRPTTLTGEEDQDTPLDIQPKIVSLWKELTDAGHKIVSAHPSSAAPTWWKTALSLFVIADECCADVGFLARSTIGPHLAPKLPETPMDAVKRPTWIGAFVDSLYLENAFPIEKPPGSSRSASPVYIPTAANVSITVMASQDVVCVQPKAHTSQLGCTLRTLSHNLAKLPPRGIVTAHWHRMVSEPQQTPDHQINVLLVPFPYRIDPAWIEVHPASSHSSDPKPWGWFDIRQNWLIRSEDEENSNRHYNSTRIVEKLLAECESHGMSINAVVLPEYALDHASLDELIECLRTRSRTAGKSKHARSAIEFLVSGTSSISIVRSDGSREIREGNFVSVTQFSSAKRGSTEVARYVSNRAKHHRWLIDAAQIDAYALTSSSGFDRKNTYWESIALPAREVHVNLFRESSIFATLICEDLARSDPCHELLRSLGPNLIFALLMDGPQLPTRWAARYATNLADDPGSSVLTLTSLALVDRSNGTAAFPPSDVVALWRDDTGRTREIHCPRGHEGVVISLRGKKVVERSLDGRLNADTCAWHFHYQQPVSLRAPARPPNPDQPTE